LKLTIERKIILIGVVSIAGLVGLSILRDIQLNKLYDIANATARNVIPSLMEVADIRYAVDHIGISFRRYASVENQKEAKTLFADLLSYQMQASESFNAYLKNDINDDQDRELIQRAQASYKLYLQKVLSVWHMAYPQSRNSLAIQKHAISQEDLNEISALGMVVDDQLREVANYNQGLIKKYEDEALETKEKVKTITLGVTIIVASLVLWLVMLIKRSTIKQLGGEPEQVIKSIGRLIDGYDANIDFKATDNASLLNQIAYLILHDSLTRLPNKLSMSHQMQHYLGHGSSSQIPFTFFKLEIHGLQDILEGDTYGVVDDIISAIVSRLKTGLPDTCFLASLDGEKFGILLPKVISNKAVEQHAKNLVQIFIAPFIFGNQHFVFRVSVGVVRVSKGNQTKDDVFECARLALTHSKTFGENHYQLYQEEFSTQYKARMEIEGALHHVLKNNELELYYQPQVDIRTDQITGAEALIRWKHPTLGMIPPDKFIPIAEENGSINEIGDWVLLTAFRAATVWNAGKSTTLRISINLSPRQFSQKDFIEKIVGFMAMTGCKSEWIKLEVTESLLMENSGEIMKSLVSITELGIPISMDDFGTGYSSLSYLTTYPISQIKIDRSFMNDIPTRLDKCEVVRMIMRIAEIMNCDVVAEGVEAYEQIEFLKSIQCNVVQGYYYYKPMPSADFEKIVFSMEKFALNQEVVNAQDQKSNVIQFSSLHA